MKELRQQEELAEIRRSRRVWYVVAVVGGIAVGSGVGFGLVDHWGGLLGVLDILIVVFGAIAFVGGLVLGQHFDTKYKEYLQHMEEDTEEDKP